MSFCKTTGKISFIQKFKVKLFNNNVPQNAWQHFSKFPWLVKLIFQTFVIRNYNFYFIFLGRHSWCWAIIREECPVWCVTALNIFKNKKLPSCDIEFFVRATRTLKIRRCQIQQIILISKFHYSRDKDTVSGWQPVTPVFKSIQNFSPSQIQRFLRTWF